MKFAISMPVYNESEGIVIFLDELLTHLETKPSFYIVDDCSTDGTFEELKKFQELRSEDCHIVIAQNESNRGHGPSFTRAVELALENKPDFLLTVDGDGQFLGSEINEFVRFFRANNLDYMEGSRRHRTDASYRKFVSAVTRLIVLVKSRKSARDANTPLRIYQLEAAEKLWRMLPESPLVPNLYISLLVRRTRRKILNFDVTSIPRRGSNVTGTMWKTRRKYLPNLKFIKFCFKSFYELMSF